MSSHHIVRENQEPALFIADPYLLSENHLHQLLEWSPTVITLSEQYETLKSLGMKVDVLLTDKKTKLDFLEENLVLIPYTEDFLPTLFDFLAERKNYAVNLILKDLNLASLKSYFDDFNINILQGNSKILFVKHYEKWLPKGHQLSLPIQDTAIISFSNTEQIADRTFQVLEDGFVKMEPQSDYVPLAEEI